MKQLETIKPVFRLVPGDSGGGDARRVTRLSAVSSAGLEVPAAGYMNLYSMVSRAQAIVADLASAQSLLRQSGASRAARAAGNDNGCGGGAKPRSLARQEPALRLVGELAAERYFRSGSSSDISSVREVMVDDQHRVVLNPAQPRLLTRSRGAPSADPQPKCRFAPVKVANFRRNGGVTPPSSR